MTEERRAHIVHLLAGQKYEEALSILDDLVDRNPPDPESRMYHLLAVRILMLRWNLSRAATEQLSDSPTTSTAIIRRFDSVARVSESTKLIQSLGRMYQTAALASRATKYMIAAGAGFVFLITLLAFQMQEGGSGAIPVYSKVVASTIVPNPTVSAKVDSLNTSGASDEDFRVAYETKGVLPNEHVKHSTGPKPTLFGTESAKLTTRHNTSDGFAERQKGGKGLNLKNSKKPAAEADNGKKSPIKVLATYQSSRAVPIRKSPRFAASTVRDIDSGISLNVLGFVGSWATVEIEPAGTTGFVRREFLIPVKENELNLPRISSAREEK